MPRRIEEDHKDFRDVYAGRIRKHLKKFIKNGSIFRTRGDGKKVRLTIPKIDIPHIVYGGSDKGVGRGPGDEGDVVGQDPEGDEPGGHEAGEDHSEGITVDVDMEEVLKYIKEELQLPDLKPKPSDTFEEVKIKYNSISMHGPESLRHNRRTMLQALKRMSASGEIHELHLIPGFDMPVQLITPINSDRRYRQYNEVRIPASNAVIFFARDGSGSMDQTKCDIVSDMAWWMDLWIRHFYDRVERVYIWHDTLAEEVDEHKFYNYRYGGGTYCSSAMNLIAKQMENRYPTDIWNVYIFYFSDGENWGNDNEKFIEVIRDKFPPELVNFVGITQVLAWRYDGSLKKYVDDNLKVENVQTAYIGSDEQASDEDQQHRMGGWNQWGTPSLSSEERDKQIKRAIIQLLGSQEAKQDG